MKLRTDPESRYQRERSEHSGKIRQRYSRSIFLDSGSAVGCAPSLSGMTRENAFAFPGALFW
ncbi:hypothetical protein ACP90_25730 [Labrenzia sp. CP4]|nr:hypothetical protein ACP90_25730 [Labrenzia sp. CP4]